MQSYTRSVSLHSIHSVNMRSVSNVLNEMRRCLPYVAPYYAIGSNSSPNLLSYLREQKVGLVSCKNYRIISPPCNEYIVRSVDDIIKVRTGTGTGTGTGTRTSTPTLWVKTAISNDGVERTREMFEYIWAHKCILNGIVFDIHNFTNGYIPPTIYSYKIATEYVFRNIIVPFEQEYGIQTPAIMIDGQDHITQLRHLSELHYYALKESSVIGGFTRKKPELRLILGALFDSVGFSGGGGRVLASHEYP